VSCLDPPVFKRLSEENRLLRKWQNNNKEKKIFLQSETNWFLWKRRKTVFGQFSELHFAVLNWINFFLMEAMFFESVFFFWSGRPSFQKDRVPLTIGSFAVHPIWDSVCPNLPPMRTLLPLHQAQPELQPAQAGIPGTHSLWQQSFSTAWHCPLWFLRQQIESVFFVLFWSQCFLVSMFLSSLSTYKMSLSLKIMLSFLQQKIMRDM
jgi:hypothetical protein